MSGEIITTIVGNLTAAPELKSVNGKSLAKLRVASTPRRFNSQTNEYEDGTTTFVNVAVWGLPGANAAKSFVKGQRVIVHGRFQVRPYTVEGSDEQRLSVEMEAYEIGASVAFGTTTFSKSTGHAAPDPEFSGTPTEDEPAEEAEPDEPAEAPAPAAKKPAARKPAASRATQAAAKPQQAAASQSAAFADMFGG